MTYTTEQEALEALKRDNSLEAYTIIPHVGIDGDTTYAIGSWNEYKMAVEAAVGYLYEPFNPDYTGEDSDALVAMYGYTKRFAEDVCEEIDALLAEGKGEQ